MSNVRSFTLILLAAILLAANPALAKRRTRRGPLLAVFGGVASQHGAGAKADGIFCPDVNLSCASVNILGSATIVQTPRHDGK